MGFIGSLFGGNRGMGYDVNQNPAMQPVTQDQLGQLYGNQQSAQTQQQAFVNALTGMNANTFQQQSQLAQQLADQAQGKGPNLAAAQLAQATGQNAARQAALMASQRGASQNAGAMARLASIQGADVQQQAAGQAATLRANQQLAAQQALGQLTGQMIQQQGGAQAVQGQLAQQGMAAGMGAAGQYNTTAANLSAQQAEMEKLRAQGQGGFMNALGGLGGMAASTLFPGMTPETAGTVIKAGASLFAEGGMVPAREMPAGSIFGSYVENMAGGGKVPGKAPFPGDNYGNDKVPAMLSPGEIVVPRSVLNSRDPAKKAAEFVAAILSKKGGKK